jgi:hypothetical protein
MLRTFQDQNFLVWEAFASTGKQGFSDDPHIVFQCRTRPESRPRWIKAQGDEADAQGMLMNATDEQVLQMFNASTELP